ncbi:flagellar biosynthesis protein FlhF [Propionivibrio sp.]|uniref:flagellar biosynthesis protein FlhF n=1 Tax=Propionivibrio sp. TaxID=2212460 RepID=UPI002601DCD4|nr:flagellar biosynthesis protein FlhF [Propionivibrio sp.]
MNVRKFIAATARDALHKVKELLGPDAIILSNRAIPGGVEIMAVAAGDMELIVPTPVNEISRPSDDYTVRLSSPTNNMPPKARVTPTPQLSPRPAPPIERHLHPPQSAAKAQAEIVPAEVMDEIRSLRKMFEQHLAGVTWGESARSEPVKTEILRQMLDAGFSPRFARELLAELPRDLNATEALAWVKGSADRSFLTINVENDIVDRGGIYALVGPTGVGKTTTTAKLAARCVLRHGASKVALVTTDGYRIGAHEQLRIYGRILGVSVHLAKDADELKQTLIDLQHKHMVLVDTMGMSQRDRMVGEQVAMFGNSHVKRLLLLSATGRGDTLDDVVRAYNGPDLAGCILSKVDEAASLASAIDVIIRHGLRLHYVSNGQRVPEDLHLPNRAYLLHRAFKGVPEVSPHRLDGLEPGLMMASAGSAMVAAGGRRG